MKSTFDKDWERDISKFINLEEAHKDKRLSFILKKFFGKRDIYLLSKKEKIFLIDFIKKTWK